MGEEEQFLRAIQKDPGLINRLNKQENLRAFKEKYDVEMASGLKCPSCAAYLQSPGSLWYRPSNPTSFTCRKCLLEFNLECKTIPNAQLVEEVKKASKGEGLLPSWLKIEEKGGQE